MGVTVFFQGWILKYSIIYGGDAVDNIDRMAKIYNPQDKESSTQILPHTALIYDSYVNYFYGITG